MIGKGFGGKDLYKRLAALGQRLCYNNYAALEQHIKNADDYLTDKYLDCKTEMRCLNAWRNHFFCKDKKRA